MDMSVVGTADRRSAAALRFVIVGALLAAVGCTSGGTAPVEAAAAATLAATAPAAAAPVASVTAEVTAPKPPPKPVSQAIVDIGIRGASGSRLPLPASGVPLDATITVAVTSGRLTTVAVTSAVGPVAGERGRGARSWTSRGPLAPAAAYTVHVATVDDAGIVSSAQRRFTTLQPAAILKTRIAPLNGETVGVAMPVIVYFNHPVTDKAAVERRLRVSSSSGAVGGWYWFSKTEVHYRPRVYWPARERVRVDVELAGVNAGKGVWGVQSRTVEFSTGRSHVSLVSAAKHTMTVKEDGKVVRSFKVSTGRDTFPTSSGVHVVMSKDAVYWMDSATIGIPRKSPDGYYKKVLSSVRISNSGEFVHAAPWSAGDQGVRNVSHGCINASVVDAAWFLRFSRRGDVVEVVGTPRKLQLGNGFADWTLSWRQWAKGSALPPA